MTATAISLNAVIVFGFTALIHYHYGNWRKHHILVTVMTFIAWYFPFLIIFLMPVDVSSTFYRQCITDEEENILNMSAVKTTTVLPTLPLNVTNTTVLSTNVTMLTFSNRSLQTSYQWSELYTPLNCTEPWSYVSLSTMTALWRVIYWTCQALTWLILPIMQSYSSAGDFNVIGRLKSALIENAFIYASYLLILIICIIYVAVKPELHFDVEQMKVLAVTASNTWGLTLLVILFGHGLVDVPRSYWNNIRHKQRLARIYFQVAKLSVEKVDAEERMECVVDEVKKVSESVSNEHNLRSFVDAVLRKCPVSVHDTLSADDSLPAASDVITLRNLIRLHRHVISAVHRYSCTQQQWASVMNDALDIEDVSFNELTQNIFTRHRSHSLFTQFWRYIDAPTLEWYSKCYVYPVLIGLLAVTTSILSVLVVWSECLFFVKSPPLSVFAVFVNVAKLTYNYHLIELVCILTLTYLCLCSYSTIFKIRIFNFYYLVGNHATDEISLIFCGMMLCRLTPPLCLNFLGLIHLDSHITKNSNIQETAFTHIMGHMDVISFISDGFNIYFPIAILLLCVLTLLNVGTRILNVIGFQQFIADDQVTQELIDEGKELVRRDRRRQQREVECDDQRRLWSHKYTKRQQQQQQHHHRTNYGKPASSPSDSDRTELLRVSETVDYTTQSHDVFDELDTDPTQLYQARGCDPTHFYQATGHAVPRPKSLPVERNWLKGSGGRALKRIFDDV